MAKKKDFSTVDTGRVYSAIEQSLAEPAQETQQAQRRNRRKKNIPRKRLEHYRKQARQKAEKGLKWLG